MLNNTKITCNTYMFRCLATQAAVKPLKEERSQESAATKESQSFTMNLFRGQLQLSQVFPFPEPMNEDQTDTIKMLIDPVEKFYEVNISLNSTISKV